MQECRSKEDAQIGSSPHKIPNICHRAIFIIFCSGACSICLIRSWITYRTVHSHLVTICASSTWSLLHTAAWGVHAFEQAPPFLCVEDCWGMACLATLQGIYIYMCVIPIHFICSQPNSCHGFFVVSAHSKCSEVLHNGTLWAEDRVLGLLAVGSRSCGNGVESMTT